MAFCGGSTERKPVPERQRGRGSLLGSPALPAHLQSRASVTLTAGLLFLEDFFLFIMETLTRGKTRLMNSHEPLIQPQHLAAFCHSGLKMLEVVTELSRRGKTLGVALSSQAHGLSLPAGRGWRDLV